MHGLGNRKKYFYRVYKRLCSSKLPSVSKHLTHFLDFYYLYFLYFFTAFCRNFTVNFTVNHLIIPINKNSLIPHKQYLSLFFLTFLFVLHTTLSTYPTYLLAHHDVTSYDILDIMKLYSLLHQYLCL